MKRLLLIIAVLLAVLLTGLIVGSLQFNHFLETPVTVPANGASFEIKPGSSLAKVSKHWRSRASSRSRSGFAATAAGPGKRRQYRPVTI